MKTGYQRDICTPMFIAALFTAAKIWKQPKCLSMDEWKKKILKNIYLHTRTYKYIHTCVYTHNGIYFNHKSVENSAICSNMDGLGGHYVKRNKSDRERQKLYDITYMWNLKI